jgi:alanine racemase
MNGSTIITLNPNAVKNNIAFLRKQYGKKVKISSVLKANAYGHGIEQMVPMLEKAGVDHFSVFEYDEAVRIYRSLSAPAAIVIMGWISDRNLKTSIQTGFEFFVFNIDRLKKSLAIARQLKTTAKIHLEAETGMNRTGLNTNQLKEAISILLNNPESFEIMGFCTHLAGPESISNHLRVQRQLKIYQQMLLLLNQNNIKPKYRHVANSAASMVYPATRMDLVRVGIMQYGFWSSAEIFIHYIGNKPEMVDPLHRVLDWKSQIMSIKDVNIGEFVGYGVSYLAQTKLKMAIVPVGYSNGYSRSLSNKGRVLVRGIRCSVIGLVNMNMIAIDVTNVDNVTEGDEVVIIGKQADLEIKVSAFSDISNMLNYEVLSHLPKNIERKVLNGSNGG